MDGFVRGVNVVFVGWDIIGIGMVVLGGVGWVVDGEEGFGMVVERKARRVAGRGRASGRRKERFMMW